MQIIKAYESKPRHLLDYYEMDWDLLTSDQKALVYYRSLSILLQEQIRSFTKATKETIAVNKQMKALMKNS